VATTGLLASTEAALASTEAALASTEAALNPRGALALCAMPSFATIPFRTRTRTHTQDAVIQGIFHNLDNGRFTLRNDGTIFPRNIQSIIEFIDLDHCVHTFQMVGDCFRKPFGKHESGNRNWPPRSYAGEAIPSSIAFMAARAVQDNIVPVQASACVSNKIDSTLNIRFR
jgi:hypothetical protein